MYIHVTFLNDSDFKSKVIAIHFSDSPCKHPVEFEPQLLPGSFSNFYPDYINLDMLLPKTLLLSFNLKTKAGNGPRRHPCQGSKSKLFKYAKEHYC